MIENSFYPSDDGNMYPWVELINHSSATLNLSDFYLSSDSSDLTAWPLPSFHLESDSIFLLWLSGKGGPNHSEFKIDSTAKYLFLTDGNKILDDVPLQHMIKNESYGRRYGYDNEKIYFINAEDITIGKPNVDPGPWVKVQGNAAFQKGDAGYFGSIIYEDKLWFLDYETLEADGSSWINLVEVWNSPDGFTWELINATPPYTHGSMVTVFKGYMWAFDGRAFRSKDGIDWELVSLNTPKSERVAVFNNCLWILQNRSIFRSFDGIVWEEVVSNAPWYPRSWPAFMEHNGKLWMFGGNTNYKSGYDWYFTDVWSSEDGTHWELVNYNAPWRGTFWFTYVSFDGFIWMIDGGYNYWDRMSPYNGNGNEVWYSKDGVSWKKSTAPTNWFNRHAQFTWVFRDELWIGAGYAGGGPHHLFNDIWRYSRRPNISGMAESTISTTYGLKTPLFTSWDGSEPLDYNVVDPSIAKIADDTLIPIKAGETTIVVTHEGDDFRKTFKQEIKLNVAKKDLIVKPVDSKVLFGQPDRGIPDLEYSGFVFGDSVTDLQKIPTIKDPPSSFSQTGTYILKAEGGEDENYTFVYKEGHLTILPTVSTLFFPNPAKDILKIVSSTTLEGKVLFQFYNSSGSLVATYTGQNFQSKEFDISSFDPGMYILKIMSDRGSEAIKIVVVE